MIVKASFGSAPGGSAVSTYALEAGGARVCVTDFGATLLGVEVPDLWGRTADVVLGFGSLAGYLDDPACYGATIGPVANRTDRAEVPLGGTVCHLPGNDGPDGRNNLHSDLDHGLHKRVWDAQVDEAACAVLMTTTLADGELGLPGNRTFSARYALASHDGAAELTVEYGCETDAPTFVNMTNHSYFNLEGHDRAVVLSQEALLEADRFIPVRADSVSEGDPVAVAGTPFDFRSPKRLGTDILADDVQLHRARGYDHCFCVRGFEPGGAPRLGLSAYDPSSGRSLQILVTTPGALLYTGNWLSDVDAKDGAPYGPRQGFAFEPEFYPDCVHHPDWPQPVCTPEAPYRSTIVYRFGTGRPWE